MYAYAMSKKANITDSTESLALFRDKLTSYKALIDADIARYSKELETLTAEQFGTNSLQATSAFTEILGRGGKRIRGALTMLAYEMFGGPEPLVALVAARAVEMLQAYVLIIDDIADRSVSRRGGPSAHILLKDWHEKSGLEGDSLHFGESIATNAALLGCHAATSIITDLCVPTDYKVKALKTLNQNLIVTAHGQFNDMYNEVLQADDEQAIENVLVWKTAYYTFISPLQFGAELAGADNETLETLSEYGLHAGRAFQIGDDIMGTFSNEQQLGKSPLDDIREGKRTLLITFALKKANKTDGQFLRQCLGNPNLNQADFDRCKQIIEKSGSLSHAKVEAQKSADAASEVLATKTDGWDATSVEFLRQLVQYLVIRKS